MSQFSLTFFLIRYWRISPRAYDLLPCPMDKTACAGGNVTYDDSCNPGYHGPLCNLCNEGMFYSSSQNACVSCNSPAGPGLIALPPLVVVFILSAYLYRSRIRAVVASVVKLKEAIITKFQITNKLKILVVLSQVRSALYGVTLYNLLYWWLSMYHLRAYEYLCVRLRA